MAAAEGGFVSGSMRTARATNAALSTAPYLEDVVRRGTSRVMLDIRSGPSDAAVTPAISPCASC
jgi:hypothetical protein